MQQSTEEGEHGFVACPTTEREQRQTNRGARSIFCFFPSVLFVLSLGAPFINTTPDIYTVAFIHGYGGFLYCFHAPTPSDRRHGNGEGAPFEKGGVLELGSSIAGSQGGSRAFTRHREPQLPHSEQAGGAKRLLFWSTGRRAHGTQQRQAKSI